MTHAGTGTYTYDVIRDLVHVLNIDLSKLGT